MVQFGSTLVIVGSSVYVYFTSELVTSARSIIRRMGAEPVPTTEAGVMQTISRLVLLSDGGHEGSASDRRFVTQTAVKETDLTNRHSSLLMETTTELPASRFRPKTVSLVPPETGPTAGRTRLKLGLCGNRRRRKKLHCTAMFITWMESSTSS